MTRIGFGMRTGFLTGSLREYYSTNVSASHIAALMALEF